MKVLITGALGFIGSHLADAYLQRGDQVIGLDDLSGNVVDRIDGMPCWHTDARNIDLDPGHGLDLVVHAASPVGAVALLDRPSIVTEIIETTLAVLRFCERHRLPLINISSSEVYGFSGVYRETDPCTVPHRLSHRLQYAAGKLAAEQLVRTSRLPSLTVRPFNVAGPRQSRAKGFVIPTFCEQAVAGEPLTVFDGGLQERCPTAVWDIVDFILGARDVQLTEGTNVVNLGNPANRTTVLELAELVRTAAGSGSPVEQTTGQAVHGPLYEEAQGRVKVPDITLAETLGWRPKVGLAELVDRTLADINTMTKALSARR